MQIYVLERESYGMPYVVQVTSMAWDGQSRACMECLC
jgi:hypothetical protein